MVSLPALDGMVEDVENFKKWVEQNERILREDIGVNEHFIKLLKALLNSLKTKIEEYKRKTYGGR